jgi:hypothetical protein
MTKIKNKSKVRKKRREERGKEGRKKGKKSCFEVFTNSDTINTHKNDPSQATNVGKKMYIIFLCKIILSDSSTSLVYSLSFC